MSPSTKNLRERITEILPKYSDADWTYPRYCAVREELVSLLSSELSLAVKGLRDSMAVRTPKDKGDEGVDPNPSDAFSQGKRECFEAFDAKAKEILGESS